MGKSVRLRNSFIKFRFNGNNYGINIQRYAVINVISVPVFLVRSLTFGLFIMTMIVKIFMKSQPRFYR